MMQKIKKVYIIAEVGINHNGSLKNCLKLIDAASGAGCDAVKFQFFKAKKLYPKSAGTLDWTDGKVRYNYGIYDAVESFELPEKWIGDIINHCKIRKIDFFSSVFDVDGACCLVKKGMKKIKLSSYVVTNLQLIEKCASFELPIIISTGGSTLKEVKDAVCVINKFHNRVSILHCSIKYPTRLDECNLGVIETLRKAFPKNTIGYSDHTKEVADAAVQAVYLGSKVIEKHITLDRSMEGPDHFFALEPAELKQMVKEIRDAEAEVKKGRVKINKVIYGKADKIVYSHEKYLRDFVFMKLFAGRMIKKGSRIRPSDLLILRPGKKAHGLDPKYINIFEDQNIIAKRDIKAEEPIIWSVIVR